MGSYKACGFSKNAGPTRGLKLLVRSGPFRTLCTVPLASGSPFPAGKAKSMRGGLPQISSFSAITVSSLTLYNGTSKIRSSQLCAKLIINTDKIPRPWALLG